MDEWRLKITNQIIEKKEEEEEGNLFNRDRDQDKRDMWTDVKNIARLYHSINWNIKVDSENLPPKKTLFRLSLGIEGNVKIENSVFCRWWCGKEKNIQDFLYKGSTLQNVKSNFWYYFLWRDDLIKLSVQLQIRTSIIVRKTHHHIYHEMQT